MGSAARPRVSGAIKIRFLASIAPSFSGVNSVSVKFPAPSFVAFSFKTYLVLFAMAEAAARAQVWKLRGATELRQTGCFWPRF